MQGQYSARKRTHCRSNDGFTIVEVLAAIVVMGIATSVFFSLFSASLSLANSSKSQYAASRLAEEHMASIVMAPENYAWPRYDDADYGQRHALARKGEDAVVVVGAVHPSVAPTQRRATERDAAFYNDFTTESYAVLASEDDNHVQVIVVVRWMLDGREQRFSLTSCLPRTGAEG